MKDVTKIDTMRDYQGDRVLLFRHGVLAHVMTVVRVVHPDKQELHLTNRECKSHKPDWPLTQALFDHFKPAPANAEQAKWQLSVKT